MKKIIYILLTLVIVAGCSNYEYNEPDPGLTIIESSLDFAQKGGEGYILVESSSAISAKSNAEWCKVQVIDTKVVVTVGSNDDIEYRTAVVSITSKNGIPVNVPVTQRSGVFAFEDISFEVWGDAQTIETSAFFDGTVTFTVASAVDWIKANYADGVISITVDANNSGASRTAIIEVTSLGITKYIKVTQKDVILLTKLSASYWGAAPNVIKLRI